MKNYYQKGITIIEVVIGATILSAVIIFIGYAVTLYIDARENMLNDTAVLYLAEEGYELVRSIRDDDWNTLDVLTLNTEYGFNVTSSNISVVASPEIIDSTYRRTFKLRALYRDSDGDVASSTTPGAAVDAESRELVIVVGSENGTSTLEAVITNLFAS